MQHEPDERANRIFRKIANMTDTERHDDGGTVVGDYPQQLFTVIWTTHEKNVWHISRVRTMLDQHDALWHVKQANGFEDDDSDFIMIAMFDGWPEEIEDVD